MKILAHSLVPVNPAPYLHLGYTSAYADVKTDRIASADKIAFAGAMLLLFGVTLLFRWKQRPGIFRWGAIGITLAGALAIAVPSLIRTPVRYAYPDMTMRSHGRAMWNALEASVARGHALPTRAREVVVNQGDIKKEIWLDGWRRPFQLQQPSQHGEMVYVLVSAGADGQFGTSDDVDCGKRHLDELTLLIALRATQEQEAYGAVPEGDTADSGRYYFDLTKHPIYDGWSRQMRLEKQRVDGEWVYTLLSAGPDGRFGTGDDLRSE